MITVTYFEIERNKNSKIASVTKTEYCKVSGSRTFFETKDVLVVEELFEAYSLAVEGDDRMAEKEAALQIYKLKAFN